MRVNDLKPRSPVTVERGENLRAASKRLADDEVGALLVFTASGAVGVFSERDLTRAVADGANLDEEPVEQYMTEAPLTVGKDSAVGEAIAKMNEYGVRHLAVVENGDVVGMISIRDIVALLGVAWPEL
jgi:CBS domain-containing protein